MNHKQEQVAKPNYNSVDMSEVELQDRRYSHIDDVNGTQVWYLDGVCVVTRDSIDAVLAKRVDFFVIAFIGPVFCWFP